MSERTLLEYGLLNACPGIFAFSTTRHGGVSTGAYASMNCTPYTGDDPQCVSHNRQLLLGTLPWQPAELVIPWQTHGTEVLAINETYLQALPDERHSMLQGIDALVTDLPDVCLCISTADCIPILLYDRRHQAIAAVHAGWRGTVNRIALHALHRMEALYGTTPADLFAAIGPGISRQAFEVGEEVCDAFHLAGFPMNRLSDWNEVTQKHHIDLPEANRLMLIDFGIPAKHIEMSGICTHTLCEDYFSARRLGTKSGRILTGIMLHRHRR